MRVDADAHYSSGPRVSIDVSAKPGPTWRDGPLQLSISTRWLIPQGRTPLAIHDDAGPRSAAEHPVAVDEHLASH